MARAIQEGFQVQEKRFIPSSRKKIYDNQHAVKVRAMKSAMMEDIEEDSLFEVPMSTVFFLAVLEDTKVLATTQILERRNKQQERAAEDQVLSDKNSEVYKRYFSLGQR